MEEQKTTLLSDFITSDSLTSLSGCAIACGIVTQILKNFITINPILINLAVALFISAIKLMNSKDYSKQNIMICILNIFPIALTASGGYDIISKMA